jgi:hypothetical protein
MFTPNSHDAETVGGSNNCGTFTVGVYLRFPAGANKAVMTINATSSLTPTKLVVYYKFTNNSDQPVTILP